MNVVLNILNKKQNLSYPLIFKKIGNYYWNKKIFLYTYIQHTINCSIEQFIVKNKFKKIYKYFDLDFMVYYACSLPNYLEEIKYLVQIGANINSYPCLLEAASCNYLEVVKYLIENKSNNYDLLDIACQHKAYDTIQYLIHIGFRICSKNFVTVCEKGDLDLLKYLFSNVDSTVNYSRFREQLLYLASKKGYLEIVKYLVEEQKVHVRSGNNMALINASEFGHLQIVKYLVEKGALIEANKFKAYNIARWNKHKNILEYFDSKLKK